MNPQAVATARRIHDDAQTEYQTANGKAQAIRDRIAASTLRQSEITAARINGQASAAETAEYAALAGDVDALKAMLAAAESDAATKLGNMHAKREGLEIVERSHATEQTRLAFNALKEKAEKLEDAFCDCVAQLHGQGQKLGHVSLVMSFRPTQRLGNIVRGVSL
jgi:hypothetical protein